MSQPKPIAWPRFLLLALFGLSFTAYEDSVIAAEGAGSFYEQLESLSSGYKELPYAATQEFEATAYDPREGLAGLKLGMSMEDVIGVWGKPKKICMQASVTVLSIGRGSQFSFKENELVTIKILSADLPSMKLSNDVDFSFSPSQLGSLYETRNTRANTYTTDVAEGIELQFQYYNPGNKGPKMIAMAIVRRL